MFKFFVAILIVVVFITPTIIKSMLTAVPKVYPIPTPPSWKLKLPDFSPNPFSLGLNYYFESEMECYCSFLLQMANGKINILMPSPSQLKSACPFSLSLVNIWMFIFNVLSLITGARRCEERTWIVWMLSHHPSPPHGLQSLPAVRNIFILICKPDFSSHCRTGIILCKAHFLNCVLSKFFPSLTLS